MEAINVTASTYLSQAARLFQAVTPKSDDKLSQAARSATKALESIQLFSDIVSPLIQEISKGLTSMGRLVGSTTQPCDADGTTVATLLECMTKLEEKVALPLKELYVVTRSREKQILGFYDKQKEQLKNLLHTGKVLQERMTVLEKKAASINENDEALSQRTASVLAASRALLPKITEKELDFFTQLKRWDNQCGVWEEKTRKAKTVACGICVSMKPNTPLAFELPDSLKQMCQNLLAGEEALLSKNKARLENLEKKIEYMVDALRLQRDSNSSEFTKENLA